MKSEQGEYAQESSASQTPKNGSQIRGLGYRDSGCRLKGSGLRVGVWGTCFDFVT